MFSFTDHISVVCGLIWTLSIEIDKKAISDTCRSENTRYPWGGGQGLDLK